MEQHLPADSPEKFRFRAKVSEAHQPENRLAVFMPHNVGAPPFQPSPPEFYFREEEPHFPPQPEQPPWQ